ncbi:hypothetical protein [Nocardioides pakistanensis]
MKVTVTARHTLRPNGAVEDQTLAVEIDEAEFLAWINESRGRPYPTVADVDDLEEMVGFFLDAGIDADANAWNPRWTDRTVALTEVVSVHVDELPSARCASSDHEPPVPAVVTGTFDCSHVNGRAPKRLSYCLRCAVLLHEAGMFTPEHPAVLPTIEEFIDARDAQATTACQVSDPGIDLHCGARESGGLRCENTEPHGPMSGHWISDHTIAHAKAGSGYPCEAIR